MTLKQLEAFYWAATLGTFAIAAERLHVTQSSLSKRIAELEMGLGQALFDRTGQRAMLSPAGQALLPQALRMLELEQAIRQGLDLDHAIGGPCRFGISELSATTWFPFFFERMAREYPSLKLKPQVGLSKHLERLVERGELDFAVITGTLTSTALDCLQVEQLEFTWMAAPSRLPKGTVLDASLFNEHPVLASTGDSGLTGALQSWAAANSIQLREVMACNSITAILSMTVAGVGISFLPANYVAPLVKRQLLVELSSEAPVPRLNYYFIWRRDDKRHLVSIIRKIVAEEANFHAPNQLWAP